MRVDPIATTGLTPTRAALSGEWLGRVRYKQRDNESRVVQRLREERKLEGADLVLAHVDLGEAPLAYLATDDELADGLVARPGPPEGGGRRVSSFGHFSSCGG